MRNIVAILPVLTAAFAYVNLRHVKWPMTIGAMAIALRVLKRLPPSTPIIGLGSGSLLGQLGIAVPRSLAGP